MHMKKAWHFFAFIGCSEVFDYLQFPITTSKAHASRRERRCFTLGIVFEVVEVSEQPDKLLRFSLFYDVHNGIMRFFSLATFFVITHYFRLQIYNFFLIIAFLRKITFTASSQNQPAPRPKYTYHSFPRVAVLRT